MCILNCIKKCLQNKQETDNLNDKNTSNYIKKHYSCLTSWLCILFVVALVVSIILTFNKKPNEISIGIIILLFSDVVLAIMSLVSMVAMFNEVSRLHAREFPKDAIDQMEKLQEKCETLSSELKTERQQDAVIEKWLLHVMN